MKTKRQRIVNSISIQDRLNLIRSPHSVINDDLVKIINLIDNDALITHDLIDQINAFPAEASSWSRNIYNCLELLSKTQAWRDDNVVTLAQRIISHTNISELYYCLYSLIEVGSLSLLEQQVNLLIDHEQLNNVRTVINLLIANNLCQLTHVTDILKHNGLCLIIDTTSRADIPKKYNELILKSTDKTKLEQLISDIENLNEEIENAETEVVSPQIIAVENDIIQLLQKLGVHLNEDILNNLYYSFSLEEWYTALNNLLETGCLNSLGNSYVEKFILAINPHIFNQIFDFVYASNLVSEKKTNIMMKVLTYSEASLLVCLQYINNPKTSNFVIEHLYDFIMPNNHDYLELKWNFLSNSVTKDLFNGSKPRYDVFLTYLIKNTKKGLKEKFDIICDLDKYLDDKGNIKEKFYEIILKRPKLDALPKVIERFLKEELSDHENALEYLEAILLAPQPDLFAANLCLLSLPLCRIFPLEPKLTFIDVVTSQSKFDKFNETATTFRILFDNMHQKDLFVSKKESDLLIKAQLADIYIKSSLKVKDAIKCLRTLKHDFLQSVITFTGSPDRDILARIICCFDNMKKEFFTKLMRHSSILCSAALDNVWRRIPTSSLMNAHAQRLFGMIYNGGDTQTITQAIINYLEIEFNLNRRAVMREPQNINSINYAQSTHNQAVHETASKSASLLFERYKDFLAITAVEPASTSSRDLYVTSLADAFECLKDPSLKESRNLKTITKQDHLNETNSIIYQEINAWLNTFSQSVYLRCFKRIQNIQYIDQRGTRILLGSQISLTTLLALFWIAIHDDEQRIGTLENALELLKSAFYEIQRGYNIDAGTDSFITSIDNHICAGGSFNKLLEKLASIHPDVVISFISLNTATAKYKVLIQECVENYLTKNQEFIEQVKTEQSLSCIWPFIVEDLKNQMYDEFRCLFTHGKSAKDFLDFIEAGGECFDVSKLLCIKTNGSIVTHSLFNPKDRAVVVEEKEEENVVATPSSI